MRWWNSALRGIKRVAQCKEGGARAIWKLLFAYAAYLLWAWLITYALSWGFGTLFGAWDLTAATAARAPSWAQWLFANYGRFISLISSFGAIALAYGLLRLLAGGKMKKLRPRDLTVGALWGLIPVLVGVALFLLMDSMRLYERTFPLTPDLLWMLAVYFAAALAEERFARGLTMRVATLHARPIWGCVASAAMLLAITGSYALPPLGIVNMLITAVLCARLSAAGHAGAAVGLRCAWSWAANALAAFPGSNAASRPALRLYEVSEHWLTGGANGLICGAWMTLVLLALTLWAFRQPLRARLRRKEAK